MSKTALLETAQYPTITVAGREFVVGPMSLYQMTKLARLISDVARNVMLHQQEREAELTRKAQLEAAAARDDLRATLAHADGVALDAIEEKSLSEAVGAFFLDRRSQLIAASGYDGAVGVFFEFVETLNEHQLAELVRILLERDQHVNVNLEWVRAHFAPSWCINVIATFVEQNDIQGIIKNSQRLAAAISTQYRPTDQA